MSPGAYTSTVVGRPVAVLGFVASVAIALVIGGVLGVSGSTAWITGTSVAVAGALASVQLAAVRVVIGAPGLGVAVGLVGRVRWIATTDIEACEVRTVNRAQVFGVGLRPSRLMTRALVRPGPCLWVRLDTGEQLWLTTSDPRAALQVLDPRVAARRSEGGL